MICTFLLQNQIYMDISRVGCIYYFVNHYHHIRKLQNEEEELNKSTPFQKRCFPHTHSKIFKKITKLIARSKNRTEFRFYHSVFC